MVRYGRDADGIGERATTERAVLNMLRRRGTWMTANDIEDAVDKSASMALGGLRAKRLVERRRQDRALLTYEYRALD